MEAGDVLVRVAQAELLQDVVPHLAGGAGRERRDRVIRKQLAQAAQLPVFRTKLVPPFGNAMRFVDGEKRQRHAPEKLDEILAQQPLRRNIEQPVFALRRPAA